MESDDDIVISGIAGRFPECENVEEFMDALLSGVDLVTANEKRHPMGIWGVPHRTGVIPTIDKFDAAFFRVPHKMANIMDPRQRILNETAYECIIDAGYNPKELRGSNTGVYTALTAFTNIDEVRKYKTNGYINMGYNLALGSNRISYAFDLKGPSYTVETACSSSMTAFTNAVRDIRSGQTEAAIVCGSHTIGHPHETLEFQDLNMLASDGKCKTFCSTRDGYARSETVASVLLQKRCNSRRVYATIVGIQYNADGYKPEGLTFPSSHEQFQLLKTIYHQSNVNPNDVSYIEAHGTGTPAGDSVECEAIAQMFLKNRKHPLLIGSVKSNMGHSEVSSGFNSLIKVITAMERGQIPPNLHALPLDTTLPGIKDNMIKVVTEKIPFPGGFVGVSSFGWGGANVHTILKGNEQEKGPTPTRPKHRLVIASGRTPEGVDYFLNGLQNNPYDEELLALVDEIHKMNVHGHHYRGYMVMGDNPNREIDKYVRERPIWFIYSGMGSQWLGMGRDLLKIEVFKKTFERCAVVLKPYNLDLFDIVTSNSPSTFNNITNCFVAIGCIQIALTDVLFSFGIYPDGIAGHSLGEVCCSYADGLVTAEDAALLAFARAYACQNSTVPQGQMAAVGLSKEEVEKMLPSDVFIACRNGKMSVTISGSKSSTIAFVEKLQSQGIFAKLVQSGDIAFHTSHVMDAGLVLLDFIRKILKTPKPRSKKWVSSSVPEGKEHLNWAKYNCPEYHYNNFSNAVLFDQVYQHIPKDAIVVEVAPYGLLQAILKRELHPENTYISLLNKSYPDNEQFLLSAIGRIFIAGGQPKLRKFYNQVSFPVRRGTKSLSPLVQWDHSISWYTPQYRHPDSYGKVRIINLNDEQFSHLHGHNIDGRVLMPATGYLVLVWQVLGELLLKDISELPVIIENIKFMRATVIPENEDIHFLINITKQSGHFEIFEGGSVVVTGQIRNPKDISKEFINPDSPQIPKNNYLLMSKEDIYKECHLKRYLYTGVFQGVTECDVDGLQGRLEWKGLFDSFLDTMLHLSIVSENSRDLMLPTGIRQVVIDPQLHLKIASKKAEIPIINNIGLNVIKSGGIEIIGKQFTRAPRRHQIQEDPSLEYYDFVPYEASAINTWSVEQSLRIALQIVIQNCPGVIKRIRMCEIVVSNGSEDLAEISKLLTQPLTEIDYSKSNMKDINGKYNVLVFNESASQDLNEKLIADYLNEDGFAIYYGSFAKIANQKFDIIFQSLINTKGIYLLRPVHEFPKKYTVINVTNTDYDWLEKVKIYAGSEEKHIVFLCSQDERISGLIGLVKCLMTESVNTSYRAVFVDEKPDSFTVDNQFCRNQLRKGLTFNILRNNNWGTFVHLPLEPIKEKEVSSACVTFTCVGDLSTVSWMERPTQIMNVQDSNETVHVFYSALNFKDVMVATGKLLLNRAELPTAPEVNIGLEYSGITVLGKRVMGLLPYEGLSLQVKGDSLLTWEIPESWSLQDAATVPTVYSTCYYALFEKGRISPGDSILIHAGTGGIGIAAITIALSLGCEVFTTVSTKEKSDYLKKMFPKLKIENIGNSRDASFEKMIMNNTNGKGVNAVLNSLSGELFQASIRCLAEKGNFLEIGKVDLLNGSHIDTHIFLKNCSFHGVHLDKFFEGDIKANQRLHDLLDKGIKNGVVKPLPRTIFKEDELETAFRYLASGKHKGKVLIEVWDENPNTVVSPTRNIKAIPKVYFNPSKSYILIGGLGGFGLELTNWMISKGATKIILNSRRIIWNGYQSFCMKKWSQHRGVIVKVNTDDTTHLVGTEKLIREAQNLGPVGGVFNMALVLRDNLIQHQTKLSYEEVFRSKIASGQNMDTLTRKYCPELDHFVVFSSIACGRGNIGQTNYGMANSALEKLCEKRRREKLPGLAIQWGPIGDVGALTKTEAGYMLFKYLKLQTITSCLDTLELFMLQPHSVGASTVISDNSTPHSAKSSTTAADAIAHIMGIKNIDLVDKALTLTQLGADSLMMAEIKQTLYRNYQVDLSPDETRDLTFNYLLNLDKRVSKPAQSNDVQSTFSPTMNYIVPKDIIVELNKSENSQKIIYIFHSIEGHIEYLRSLAKKLNANVYGLQCTKECNFENMNELACCYIKEVKKKQPSGPYYFCGYSFGSAVALEMGLLLEQNENKVDLVLIDGSPSYVKTHLANDFIKHDQSLEKSSIATLSFFATRFPNVDETEVNELLENSKDWSSKLQNLGDFVSNKVDIDASEVSVSAERFYQKCKAAFYYEPNGKFKGKMLLIRVEKDSFQISEDYDLQKICENKVNIVKLDGDHRTILANQQLANAINEIFV